MNHAATASALALAIGALCFITSQSKISRAPRVWIASRKGKVSRWISDLAACPVCTATWMALAATAVYRPLLVHEWWPLDYFVTALAITGVAMLPVLVIKQATR